MAATAQAQKIQTGSWESMFPTEQVTESQSVLFVKKLLAVAISNITYLRAIFPESAYGDRCLEELNLKILRDDSSCPGARQLIRWIKGCFDALEKKFLKMIILGIYQDPENSQNLIESYTFKFSYANQGGIDIYRNNSKITEAFSEGETKKATIRLLHTILILIQSLKSLPENVMMTMKLRYYEEITPADYEPPYFHSCNNPDFEYVVTPKNIKVGDVTTPFHTVRLRMKTDSLQFNPDDEYFNCSQVEDSFSQHDCGAEQTVAKSTHMDEDPVSVPQPGEADEPIGMVPNQPGNKDAAGLVSEQTTPDVGNRCPCGAIEDDGLMIQCSLCNYWQHGICFLVKNESEAPSVHVCNICAKDEKEATDPQLLGSSTISAMATCLWRRTLFALLELSRILTPVLAKRLGIETASAQGLMNRLEAEGYITTSTKGKRLGKIVNKEKILNEALAKYLSHKPSNSKENSISDEVANLAKQTKDLELNKQKQNVPNETKNKLRGTKRLRPVSDPNLHFDVSSSQDVSVSSNTSIKRAKTSEVTTPLVI